MDLEQRRHELNERRLTIEDDIEIFDLDIKRAEYATFDYDTRG